MKALIEETNRYFKTDIRSRDRHREIVEHRKMYMVFMRELGFTLNEIGLPLNRHHTTVLHNLQSHDDIVTSARLRYNWDYLKKYNAYYKHISSYYDGLFGDITPEHRFIANAYQAIGLKNSETLRKVLFNGLADKDKNYFSRQIAFVENNLDRILHSNVSV